MLETNFREAEPGPRKDRDTYWQAETKRKEKGIRVGRTVEIKLEDVR